MGVDFGGRLGQLLVEIGADIDGLDKGLKEANKKVKDAEKKMAVSAKGIGLAFLSVSGAIVGALGAAVAQTVAYGNELFEMSQRTGIAVETLSRLKFVAEQTESSFADLATGFKFLSRNLAEANNDNKQAQLIFERLGVSIKDANGQLLTADEAFLRIADRFKAMEDPAEKTALAMEIFGRSGSNLIPVLNLGSEGIQQLSKRAEELGLVLTGENAAKIDQFDDSLKEMKSATGALAVELGQTMIPMLTNFVNAITDAVRAMDPFLKKLQIISEKTPTTTEQIRDAFSNQDPVITNASEELVGLQGEKDILRQFQERHPDADVSSQIADIEEKEQRLNDLINERRGIQAEAAEERLQQEAAQQEAETARAEQQRVADEAAAARVTAMEVLKETFGIKEKQREETNAQFKKRVVGEQVRDGLSALQRLGEGNKAAAIAFKAIETGKTIIAGARAFTEALPNLALAALVAASTAAQLAVINGVGFAEGTDTVPAMLSPGEMIVPRTFADSIRRGDLTLGGPSKIANSNVDSAGRSVIIENINIEVNGNLDQDAVPDIAEQLGREIDRESRYVGGSS